MSHETAMSLGEQRRAIEALAALATAFPILPSDTLTVGRVIAPSGVALGIHVNLHTTFADFEAWREALRIAAADVHHEEMDTIQTLRAYAVFNGVDVELTAFTPRSP
ncbi:hypothetical protein [Streptomyces sp. 8N616]|uniref:hypothetical protein n=1 Tax=Streptomyces sp. 8N616 TaxID=3457414 RepID=UPI003FD3B330